MQGSDLIRVGWTLLKAEFAIKPLKMSYTQIGTSYQVYAVSPSYGLWTIVVDPAEVADFEANYKAAATSVGSADEAVAITMLPQVTSSILNSRDSGRSFGYLATAAVATVTVRASVYTPPGNNAQRSVKSTNANDSAAGTGARKVKITYLDAACNGPFTETVTLNGVTGVNTVATNIALIEKLEVAEVGSGGGNAGAIQLMTGLAGGGSVIGQIQIGDNLTYWAHHYVPAGKKCSITGIDGASSVAAGGLTPNVLNPISALVPQRALDVTMRHGTVHIHRPYTVPIPVDGPAIIFLNERPDVATASTIFAGFAWIQF